ncbi:anti-sigma factor [Kribbella sp. NPDC051770]|uniref:anti-sigma factor n=1 Tax=Kribbella sp. NPDC051770 TaxID=3155413 RepID=UPI0034447AE7
MTTHLDDEQLAAWAFERVAPSGEAADHLRDCAECAGSLEELRELAGGELPRIEAPPAEVWERVSAELGLAGATPVRRRGRWSVVLAASVAAVLGIGVGIGGTLLVGQDEEPATVVQLAPLAGKSGSGTAGLVRSGGEQQLRVSASGLAAGSGYFEVWLINEDGKRMVSLGVLAGGHDGTFQVPGDLPAQGYRIVDVSLEPDDGNPAHSLDSIIRGTLPA